MINLKQVKEFIRVDFDDDDTVIQTLMTVAVEYMTSLTGYENDFDAPKAWDLCCLLLIGHWYANRESVQAGSLIKVPHSFESLLKTITPVGGLVNV
ncbi:head-tail connector protein [Ketogulonicigenium vulgare]|uniref:head-tail connector protein n=1 Tax=Ketogulonicigenium vulgare TaxID=92945 RepID=UPI0023597843|nr:head-tail connector protein [Ketogulonicigenium vulgare]